MQKLTLSIRKALLPIFYPVRNAMRPRRFHEYAVGLPRTGTHSLAWMFEDRYRAKHEPTRAHMIDLIYARELEGMSDADQAAALRQRDHFLWLELESSNHVSNFAPLLASLFAQARFIVLLRDPYTWLNSVMTVGEENAEQGVDALMRRAMTAKFGFGRLPYSAHDTPLERRTLAPLQGYCTYYETIYTRLLTELPADRRLVVYTQQITQKVPAIAAFLGIDLASLKLEAAHSDARPKQARVLDEFDRAYLDDHIQRHCGALMAQYFPQIRTLEDAFKRG